MALSILGPGFARHPCLAGSISMTAAYIATKLLGPISQKVSLWATSFFSPRSLQAPELHQKQFMLPAKEEICKVYNWPREVQKDPELNWFSFEEIIRGFFVKQCENNLRFVEQTKNAVRKIVANPVGKKLMHKISKFSRQILITCSNATAVKVLTSSSGKRYPFIKFSLKNINSYSIELKNIEVPPYVLLFHEFLHLHYGNLPSSNKLAGIQVFDPFIWADSEEFTVIADPDSEITEHAFCDADGLPKRLGHITRRGRTGLNTLETFQNLNKWKFVPKNSKAYLNEDESVSSELLTLLRLHRLNSLGKQIKRFDKKKSILPSQILAGLMPENLQPIEGAIFYFRGTLPNGNTHIIISNALGKKRHMDASTHNSYYSLSDNVAMRSLSSLFHRLPKEYQHVQYQKQYSFFMLVSRDEYDLLFVNDSTGDYIFVEDNNIPDTI